MTLSEEEAMLCPCFARAGNRALRLSKAWTLLCLLWVGCSLATDFDRDKISGGQDGSTQPDGSDVNEAGGGDGDATAGQDGGGTDTGVPADTGPAVGCNGNNDCGADQLCCDNLCVGTSVASRCSSCTQGCDSNIANTCKQRTCGCDNGAVCSGDRPFCASENAGGCAECRTGLNDCAGRSDGKTQCVKGACAACEPTSNSGCSGTTPICDASTLTCVKCSMTADKCGGKTVCTASGACGGCDDATDCATPTTPICDMTTAPSVCRSCGGDPECDTQLSRPYCVNDGRCGVCKPVASAADPGCDLASAMPSCRLNAGQYQCQACNANSQCGGAAGAGVRATCSNGRCVECTNDTSGPACGDATKPFCATDGSCKSCTSAGAAFCALSTLTLRPFCDSTSGRCVACRSNTDCGGMTPVCNTTTHQCRACAMGTEATDCGGSTPACDTSGRCVPCTTASGCTGTNGSCLVVPANPATNSCVDCTGSVTGECGGTTPQCNTASHVCVACTMPSHCDDNNMCTIEKCTANVCGHDPIAGIGDAFTCTDDACVPTTGAITHTPNHGNCVAVDTFSCTVPTCDPAMGNPTTGCREVPTDMRCDDNLSCTTNTCVGATGDSSGCQSSSTCTLPAVCDVQSGTCI